MVDQKHKFALYVPDVLRHNNQITFSDERIFHRLVRVLRVQKDEYITIFDATHHGEAQIAHIGKTTVQVCVLEKHENAVLLPHVTVLLSLLKREALEEAVYYCTEMGATQIQLVATEKVIKKDFTEHDLRRLQAMTIAAAEQSKNFCIPKIHKPVPLQSVIKTCGAQTKFLCDVDGKPAAEVMRDVGMPGMDMPGSESLKEVAILVGPEGDLTDHEKKLAIGQGFVPCALTPTVLRAPTAVAVSLGMVRSLFR